MKRSSSDSGITTRIAKITPDDVTVRGKSLTRDAIGRMSFTEMTYFHVVGRTPTPGQVRVLDACLVALMEHGLTPSSIAARLVYSSSPEAVQAGIAAGLLAVGSVFVGTVEGCSALLERIVAAPDGAEAEAARIAAAHAAEARAVPGFGHPQHKPDDPRSPRILQVATEAGVAGRHVAALAALARAVDAATGRHVTVNATGAVAAALADAQVPTGAMRGLAILARCAGLVGHIQEERTRPAARALWEGASSAVTYED
jgi:citrate synthase